MVKTYQIFRIYIPLTWGEGGILYEQHVKAPDRSQKFEKLIAKEFFDSERLKKNQKGIKTILIKIKSFSFVNLKLLFSKAIQEICSIFLISEYSTESHHNMKFNREIDNGKANLSIIINNI